MSKKELVIDIYDVKVIRVCSATNVLLKYNWYLNLTNNKAATDFKLQNVEKYWKRTA